MQEGLWVANAFRSNVTSHLECMCAAWHTGEGAGAGAQHEPGPGRPVTRHHCSGCRNLQVSCCFFADATASLIKLHKTLRFADCCPVCYWCHVQVWLLCPLRSRPQHSHARCHMALSPCARASHFRKTCEVLSQHPEVSVHV